MAKKRCGIILPYGVKIIYNDNDPVECPVCYEEFMHDSFESNIGTQHECEHCGTCVEITEIDYSRTFYWSTAASKRWYDFCLVWGQIVFAVKRKYDKEKFALYF